MTAPRNAREALEQAAEIADSLVFSSEYSSVDHAMEIGKRIRALAASLPAEAQAETERGGGGREEWRLGSEKPWVSGWQWIDYWTPDGLPGCSRYTFGDPWDESTIACWRFRGTMPPYAAAPSPFIAAAPAPSQADDSGENRK